MVRTIRVETIDGKLRYELSPSDTDIIYVDGVKIEPTVKK